VQLANRRSRALAKCPRQAALHFVGEGDIFVVTKLDRLARSITHVAEISALLERKKAALQILAMDCSRSWMSSRRARHPRAGGRRPDEAHRGAQRVVVRPGEGRA
jgi:hypothetical protein